MVPARWSRRRLVGVGVGLLVLLFAAACGGSDGPTDPTAQDLEFIEGSWQATTFRMTSQQNPSLRVDVLASGASFSLTVESDGRYVATLVALGQSNVERGSIVRTGTQLQLNPVSPPGASQRVDWRMIGQTLVLEGPSDFDFNLDLTPEPAQAYIELQRS